MGNFAIVVLGAGLITLGAALIVSVVWSVDLPSGITELGISVLALVGRALLSRQQSGGRTNGGPPDRSSDPFGAGTDGSGGDPQETSDLATRPAVGPQVGEAEIGPALISRPSDPG